ncbi:MAG: MBL fold metallo-hydrolase [bacterium JZ-2024 1]
MNELNVLCLGTSGWLATHDRETACYLIPVDDSVIFLDAGSGMRRLLEPPQFFANSRHVHVFLTHYHLDHTIGLTYAPAVFRDKQVTFYLPSERFSGIPPGDFVTTFFGSFLFPVKMKDLPFEWKIQEYDEGDLALGSVTARVWKQVHTPFSAGIAIQDQVAYLTDAVFDPALADHIHRLPIVLIAVMFDQALVGNPAELCHNGHMTNEGARLILRESQVQRAYAIHQSPLYSAELRANIVARLREVGIPIARAVDNEWIPGTSRT